MNLNQQTSQTPQFLEANEQHLEAQFEQQQRTDDLTVFNVEKELRNNGASFNQV